MSQTGSYITALVWETSDSEGPTRAEYQINWNAVDGHTHDNRGAGQGVRAVQTTNAPAQAGDVEQTGDDLKWWGTSALAVRTAANVEGTQTISGDKTFSGKVTLSGSLVGGMILFQDTLLGGITQQFAVNNIPQTYKHMRLYFSGRSTGAVTSDTLSIQLNADGGNNYDQELLSGNVSTASASQISAPSQNSWQSTPITGSSSAANAAGSLVMDFPDYAGTTFWKTMIMTGGQGIGGQAEVITGTYRSTSGISSILITSTGLPSGYQFAAGSRLTVYLYG